MRTHHALQPRTPEQSAYSTGRRDGKRFLKLYRSYLHGSLAAMAEPVYEGTVEREDDWRLTAPLPVSRQRGSGCQKVLLFDKGVCGLTASHAPSAQGGRRARLQAEKYFLRRACRRRK